MKLRTKLLLGYSSVFVLMITIAIINDHSKQSILESQQRVAHTNEVIVNGYLAKSSLQNLLIKKRDYFLSANEDDVQRFKQEEVSLDKMLEKLSVLVKDNPNQLSLLADIGKEVEHWIDLSQSEIAERRKIGLDPAKLYAIGRDFNKRTETPQVFAKVMDGLDDYIKTELDLFAKRNEIAATSVRNNSYLIYATTIFAIMLGLGALFYTVKQVLSQIGGEPGEIANATRLIAQGNLDVELSGDTGIAASVKQMVATLKDVARQANIVAGGNYNSDITPRSDNDELMFALKSMTAALQMAETENNAREWLKNGLARLNDVMQGDLDINSLAGKVISEIASWMDAKIGALYVAQESGLLILKGSYAYVQRKNLSNEFRPGEGLVGQAALEKQQILISNVPDDYIKVTSGIGEHAPHFICVTPFVHENRLKGVIELGTLGTITPLQLEYLQQAMPALAVAIESAQNRTQLSQALTESQQLIEEIQAQQEELKVANEELQEQTQRLKQSEEEFKSQQEKLQVSNEELEEKNNLLYSQKREVENARKDLSIQKEELALASKYKSEFLANMSHELRTPLNSLLLLAQSLLQNKEGNLTDEQVESAQVIYGSGNDLLNLINEILDLSKIEAGHMDLNWGTVTITDLKNNLHASFNHMAQAKGLDLKFEISKDIPDEIVTDRKRIDQILRNLISNALKFTEKGDIAVIFGHPLPGLDLSLKELSNDQALAITVKDTGIGIPPDKQKLIFEAFQQADGTTTRKYGGTGLGLTISRELASLLGGEIHLVSAPGQGSSFTLYLPLKAHSHPQAKTTRPVVVQPGAEAEIARQPKEGLALPFIPDDRDTLDPTDTPILVIEDDAKFAVILRDRCHDKGFKCLAAPSGEDGLELAGKFTIAAIILDLRLPGMDGMAVLAALKEDTRTRHIPVHIVSVDEHILESLRKGAVGHAIKPLSQDSLDAIFRKLEEVSASNPKRVLVVEDDDNIRRNTVQLIGNGNIKVDEAESGESALKALLSDRYDCVVLDLKLPDMSGKELLTRLEDKGVAIPPVVVHTAKELTPAEEEELREYADSIVVKGIRSPERLLDEVSLFLHRVVSQMPEKQRKIITDLYDSDVVLRNKKVLVVDDDMRTAFAISKLLTGHGMTPFKAENGERALQVLADNPDIEIILMDVMMPVMDGYETTRRIRTQERFRKLPIIALTAKAMPEDREKCLAAGTSDYLTKPVEESRLISMMRVWLYS